MPSRGPGGASQPGPAGEQALRQPVDVASSPAPACRAKAPAMRGGRCGGRSRRRCGGHRQRQRLDLQGPGRGSQGQRGRSAGDRPPGQGPDGCLGGPFDSAAQAGRGRVGGPRLLSPGRLMPMSDDSLDTDFVCPVCRAAQAWSDSCRRCRCDLRLLRRADAACRQARQQALLASSRRPLGRCASVRRGPIMRCSPAPIRGVCWPYAVCWAGIFSRRWNG